MTERALPGRHLIVGERLPGSSSLAAQPSIARSVKDNLNRVTGVILKRL